MKNSITELVFILDKSGSMSGLESDTVGGFNAMIEKQKKLEGDCFVTTVLFSDKSETLHDRIELSKIAMLSERDYCVGGCTALIDALGKTIEHIKTIHKYARAEDIPETTMFIITTDGMENASRHFDSDRVKAMIEEQKKIGWEFLFIGANIDAVETAAKFGIAPDRAVNYNADKTGTEIVYASVCDAVSQVRSCAPLTADWSNKIESDHKKRGKRQKD